MTRIWFWFALFPIILPKVDGFLGFVGLPTNTAWRWYAARGRKSSKRIDSRTFPPSVQFFIQNHFGFCRESNSEMGNLQFGGAITDPYCRALMFLGQLLVRSSSDSHHFGDRWQLDRISTDRKVACGIYPSRRWKLSSPRAQISSALEVWSSLLLKILLGYAFPSREIGLSGCCSPT